MSRVTFTNKTIYVITSTKSGSGRKSSFIGDLERLVNDVYGYTIESNGYCKEKAKSLKTLLHFLNDGNSYWSATASYEGRKATPEEIENYKNGKIHID